MKLNTDRIDEAVLALLHLGLHNDGRAWKSFDWVRWDGCTRKATSRTRWVRLSRWCSQSWAFVNRCVCSLRCSVRPQSD